MLKDAKSWKMGLHYLFSIKTIPKVLKEAFSFNYALTMLLIYLSFIYLIYKNYSKVILSEDISNSFEKTLLTKHKYFINMFFSNFQSYL